MDESRAELPTYGDILEITDRVKKGDVKKEKKDPAFSHANNKIFSQKYSIHLSSKICTKYLKNLVIWERYFDPSHAFCQYFRRFGC